MDVDKLFVIPGYFYFCKDCHQPVWAGTKNAAQVLLDAHRRPGGECEIHLREMRLLDATARSSRQARGGGS